MGAIKTDILKTSRIYQNISFSCPQCVKGLIKNRSVLDKAQDVKLYSDRCDGIVDYVDTCTPDFDADQVIMDVFMVLDDLFGRVDINDKQRTMVNMFFEGYDNLSIEEETGITRNNIDKNLNTVVKKITDLNSKYYMDMLHYNGLVKVKSDYKQCSKCGEYKEIKEFIYNKTNNNYETKCKICRNSKINTK